MNIRESDIKRFWSKVDASGPCWEWKCSANRGYGQFWLNGRNHGAHRISWLILVGPPRPGLVLDHVCRNPKCVNPDHLREVTDQENIVAGYGPSAENYRKEFCVRGHKFTRENTIINSNGGRLCRKCSQKRWTAANNAKSAKKEEIRRKKDLLRARAIELKQSGMTHQQVADALGVSYKFSDHAWNYHKRRLVKVRFWEAEK